MTLDNWKILAEYINSNKFDENQLRTIFDGLDQHLNVSVYAKEEFDYEQMDVLCYALSSDKYKKGLFDINDIAKTELNEGNMRYILCSFNEDVDIKDYKHIFYNNKYHSNQLWLIYNKFIKRGLREEIKYVANPDYSYDFMGKIYDLIIKNKNKKTLERKINQLLLES